MKVLRRRLLPALLMICILALGALLLIPSSRQWLLGGLGHALVHNDPLEPQGYDAIVIAVDGSGPEVLEAADLVHEGYARQVWVLAGPPDELGLEFARHGLPYADKSTIALQTLHALGVRDASLIEPRVNGSNNEAALLPTWCKSHRFERVLLIAVADHSGRIHRMLDRSLASDVAAGPAAGTIRVRYSRYAPFKPDGWWTTRGGTRTLIVEFQKLMLDWIEHP